MSGVSYNPMNGRLTAGATPFSYKDAKPQKDSSNQWSSTENNRNNARNVNFNNGNANNNNKNNGNVVRPVAASQDYDVPEAFVASVWEAYFDCLRGKMRSKQAVEYMEIADEDIPKLALELWSVTYHPGTSTAFLVHYPKLREVFAANFRDRIVHHWICLRLNPLFEERFEKQGNVSFNCRKEYGTEKAVQHVADGMQRVSCNYKKKAWVFKGDLVGFFMSIDKELLWYLLERFMRRQRTRQERHGWKDLDTAILARLNMEGMPDMYWDILVRTTKVVVMHHPEQDCILNTYPQEWLGLAPNKSLFTSPTGEPIGNLTTQLFANFLMSHFVAYIQWLYRGKNYCFAQFVDDFVIVCDDLRFLVDSIPKIEAFLSGKLRLKLHKNKRYLQPVSHGVKFVGAYIKPKRIYLSNQTVARMTERCHGFAKLMAERELEDWEREHMEQTLNSYLGFTRRRKTYKFRKSNIEGMGHDFWRNFYVKGRYETVRRRINIKPRHEHLRTTTASSFDDKDAEGLHHLLQSRSKGTDAGGARSQRDTRHHSGRTGQRDTNGSVDSPHGDIPPRTSADGGRLREDGSRHSEEQVHRRLRGGHIEQLRSGTQEGVRRGVQHLPSVESCGEDCREGGIGRISQETYLCGDNLLKITHAGGILIAETIINYPKSEKETDGEG